MFSAPTKNARSGTDADQKARPAPALGAWDLRRTAPYLGYGFMTLVGWTTRLTVHGDEHRQSLRRAGRRFIYAFWHSRQVFFTYSHRGDGLSVLVSRSRDGEIIARVMELSQIEACRGSSNRGAAAALRDMMAVVGRGLELGITPDGPKGPVNQVKPGVVFLAQKLGIPILPTANATSRKLVIRKSWDGYQVPLPFARAVIRYAPPIFVGQDDDLREKAEEVRRALSDITHRADEEVGG